MGSSGRVAGLAFAAIVAVAGCGVTPTAVAPVPSGPCLDELPEISNFSFDRLVSVSIESQVVAELVRFTFERSDPGFISLTVQPAKPPWFAETTGEEIAIEGDRHTSIRFEGLRGIGAGDRLAADAGDGARIREVVRIQDRNTVHWVVGSAAGTCIRLHVDEAAAVVTIHVSGP